MKLKKILASILCVAMVLSTMGTVVFADDVATALPDVDVAVDSTTTWSNAISNATDVNGDGIITYGISGKVTVDTTQIKGNAASIYIIGLTDDAELCVDTAKGKNGNIYIKDNTIETVDFANITLSRLNGSWVGDVDNTNKFFTVWTYQSNAKAVNYTNCVFPNGTSAAYPGATTYTNCQFNNETDFGLWVYAKGDVTVNGGSFNSYGGVKTYGYANQTDMSTVVEGADFNVTNKPAVVVSGLGTVDLDNVDVEDCTYGVWEVGVVGGNTATVTLDDVEPTFVAQCQDKYGVTIYVTDADYADVVAEEANSTTNSPVDNVAKIVGEDGYVTYYTSLHAAISEAQSGDVVEVLKDETYDVWNSIWNKDGIIINGNGNTVTVNKIDSGVNGGAMLLKASNLTINNLNVVLPDAPTPERERLASMYSGSLNNVTITGGANGISVLGEGNVVINDCEFSGLYDWAIETEGRSTSENASLTISNSTFDDSAIIIRGKNTTFNDNTITEAGEGVNVLGDAVITGNDFGESTLGIDRGVVVTIEKNIINNVELSTWLDGDYSDVTVENNTLSAAAVETLKAIDEDVLSVDYVATVNGKAYYSLTAAVAALEEGDTLAIASGRYDGFDILVDDVTITGMTPDAEITINSIPGNAFIGINAEGVSVENLKFIIPEDCQRTGNYLDGFDAVIGYWSKNFDAGSNVTTGYNVNGCHFVNEHSGIGVAMFNFSSFEIVGNTFENFNVGIHTMSDGSAMGDVVINGNTFINVNEPVNVYWGQTGNDDDSIAITGNNFVSAKDADEIKITIHDYASTAAGTAGIDAIDLSGNTFSAATEVELVDAATDISSTVESTLENVENVIVDTKYSAVARIGEDKYFTSIEAAVAGAQANDTIEIFAGTYNAFDVPAELNNVTFVGETDADGNNLVTIKTLEEGIESHTGGVFVQAETTTFKNLNFTAGETIVNSRVGWMTSSLGNTNGDTGMRSSLKNLTVENCNFVGSGVQYAIWTNQGNVTVKNSTITNYATGIDTYAIGADQKMIIENTEITDVNNAFHTGEAKEGSEIIVTDTTIDSNLIHVGGAVDVTVTDSEIKNAVIKTYTANNAMNISNTLFINSVIDETAMGTYNGVNIAEDYDAAVAAVAANNEIISTKLNISFRQVEAGLYDIVLDGEDDIYEFVGAELTFDNDSLTAGNEYMNYEILGISGKTNAEKSIEKADTYALRLVDGAERMSGKDLVIGQVKFFGQGDIYFTVSAGKVVTTQYGTNLGQYYTVDEDAATEDNLIVEGITNGAVEEVTRTVVVNVAYKHALDGTYWKDAAGNAANQITVTLKDGFGNVYDAEDLTNGVATINNVKLGRLTVTLEAPGFRKYVYNTTLTEGDSALVLNFWNDIKRNTVQSPLAEIEAGVSGETDKNFVVGDIVMDYTVDEYDLAAVTSYYGMYKLTDADKYIKYDLNRDGNIDIIDVHYVLHTLGN